MRLAVLCAVAFLVTACGPAVTPTKDPNVTVYPATYPSPWLKGYTYETIDEIRYVTGTVVNVRDYPLPEVFVRFKVYDSSNAWVGYITAYRTNLGPGEEWKFRGMPPLPASRTALVDLVTDIPAQMR